MEEAIRFVKRWTEESSKDGFERYIREKCFEAEEKGELRGEKQKSVEIAYNLLNRGMSLEEISDITNINISKLKKMQSS